MPDLDLDQFAWLTPLKGDISPECLEASIKYVQQLSDIGAITDPTNIPGPITMFDSNGKLPIEGFLSDTMDISVDVCQGDESCMYSLPHALRFIVVKIPIGYSINPGNMAECLAIENFESSYCNMNIHGPPGTEEGGMGPLRIGNDNMSGERIFQLINSISNLNPIKSKSSTENMKVITMDLKSIQSYVTEAASFNYTITTDRLYLSLMSVYAILAQPKIGMCFPAACTTEDVNKNFANLTAASSDPIEVEINFNDGNGNVNTTTFTIPSSSLSIDTPQCYSNENKHGTPESTPGSYIFFYVLYAIIGSLVVLGTLSETTFVFILNKKPPSTLPVKLLHSYSMYSNGKRLLSTESVGKDHLDCMNGMRFISMTWVAVGHSFISAFSAATRNAADGIDLVSQGGSFLFEVILTAVPSVDSFFMMSGTLTTYIFLKELDKAGKNPIKHTVTLVMFYLHRYLRLTIPYLLIMGVVISVLPFVYHGPGWDTIIAESESCQKHWLLHLLYIHTLVKDNVDDRCMGVTWYLVDDMMFHVFSPIVIYPMFILFKTTKKHMWSVLFWVFTLCCFTFGVFYISYTTNQPPIMDIQINGLEPNYTYHVDFYFAPWARYQAYLIGIVLGYVLHHCRGKPIKIRADVNIYAWEAAFLGAFAVVFGLHTIRQTHEMTLFAATMYNTFQRIAWNGALAWVIFSCSKGHGGIINEFLSWSAFAPLSRLTFCTYLIHMNVITMFGQSVLSSFPNDFEMFTSVWYYLAIQFISCCVAFGFALIFEVPATRAEKLIVEAVLGALFGANDKQSPVNKPLNTADITNEELNTDNKTAVNTAALEDGTTKESYENGSARAKQAEAEASLEAELKKLEESSSSDSNSSGGGSNPSNTTNNTSSSTPSAPPSYDQIISEADTIQKA